MKSNEKVTFAFKILVVRTYRTSEIGKYKVIQTKGETKEAGRMTNTITQNIPH